MPEYGSVVLLVFMLVSCVYQRHVHDWRLFRYGCYVLFASMALVILAGFLQGRLMFSWAGQLLSTTTAIGELVALVLMVRACLVQAERSAELRCPGCDYRLKGLSEPRCPECGFTI